jgi:hypothetical protein
MDSSRRHHYIRSARKPSLASLAILLCFNARAQSSFEVQACEDYESYRHILTSARPIGSLRQDNITDEEVREVQRAALEVYPDSIVNISGVAEGCDCEEGPRCTAQVWLVLYNENQTRGLELSKIDGHWKVGALQSWWLQYAAHQKIFHGFGRGPKDLAWQQENQRLLGDFPTCPAPTAKWTLLRSALGSSTCVDMSTMEVSGSIRRVSFKSILPRRKPGGWRNEKYHIDLVSFDCKDNREQINQTDIYYDDGTAFKTPLTDPVEWSPIRPETVSAADMNFVCRWTGGK